MSQWNAIFLCVVILVTGWFIYHYLEPFLLIRRRALLKELFTDKSWLRRFFWRGEFLRAVTGIKALILAALAISLLAGAAPYEKIALASGLPFLAVIAVISWKLLAPQLVPQYRFATALRFGYWASFAIVLAGMTWWAIVEYEVPRTALLDWRDVAQIAYEEALANSTWKPFGALIGVNSAITASVWHLLQVVHVAEVWGLFGYLTVCALMLTWLGVKLAIIWLIPLGIAAAIYRQKLGGWRILGDGQLARGYAISLSLLFIIYLALTQIALGPHNSVPTPYAVTNGPTAEADCDSPIGELVIQLDKELPTWRSTQQSAFDLRVQDLVSRNMDAAFETAEQGIDLFLDWNYSVTGQYQQLLYMGMSVTGTRQLQDFITEQLDAYIQNDFNIALGNISQALEQELTTEIRALWQAQAGFIDQLARDNQCTSGLPDLSDLSIYMEKSLVGAGSGAAILSARIGTSTGARIVGRQAISRFLTALGGKLVARAPYVLASAWIGKLCGPGVIVCAPALAITAWVVTDILINMGDEALNRDRMREEMLAALQEDRESVEAALVDTYHALSALIFSDIERFQGEVFNPLRDGR